MRVCILSMQRVNNYGSVLQAYALKSMLESLGCEVEFIDVKINDEEYEKYRKFYKHIIEQHFEITGLRRYLKLDEDFFNRIRHRLLTMSNRDAIIFDDFREKFLGIKKELTYGDKKYDACIIGSDEVFNCLSERWGYVSQLFGNVDNANKIFSYAASCGHASADLAPDEMKKDISKYLSKMCAVSVRDENTRQFVADVTGKTAELHLDPVLVYDFDKEIDEEKEKIRLPKKYCLVYAYGCRINDSNEIEAIKKYCKSNKMELLTIGGYQDFIGKHLEPSPFNVLKAFKQASLVITDTFHGTVMSYKYAKRFAVILRDSNVNKLKYLTERLHIESHVVNGDNTLEKACQAENNVKNNGAYLEGQRKLTIDYLTENLK